MQAAMCMVCQTGGALFRPQMQDSMPGSEAEENNGMV